MLDPVRDIARVVKAASETGAHLRIAKVTGVFGGKVQLDIADDAWVALDADVVGLKVGDRVYALQEGSVIIVTGRLGQGGTTAKDVPVGALVPYAGGDAAFPEGYLPCDGRAVSRSTYALLFQRLGTSYGGGDGGSTFNLPNLSNRTMLGDGARGRGATGGAERVTLSEAQMPGHDHGAAGAHVHRVYGAGGVQETQSGFGATSAEEVHSDTSNTGSHTHGWRGNNESHDNMMPFQVVRYVIRVL